MHQIHRMNRFNFSLLVATCWGLSSIALAQEVLPPSPDSAAREVATITSLNADSPPVIQPETPPAGIVATAPVYVSPYAGSLWERPVLLGSLGGTRDELAAQGYTFNISSTQFYQGITSGGIQREFQYSGRNDYYLNVDGEKAGLWKGSFITLHGETRYGDTVNAAAGAIIPPNSIGLFPVPNGSVTALTGVKFTQALSENILTFAGKINMLDELKQPFGAGRGVDGFVNTGLIFPVAAARSVPYSTLGGGFAVLQDMQPVFVFMVMDTHNTPTTSGFETFFTNGATMLAKLDLPVTFMNLPGHQGIWGTYSTGKYNDLQPTAYFNPNTGFGIASGQETSTWSLFYSADQALYVDPCDPKRSWGLFTNIGLADNGPSPVRWSANVGFSGSSPLASRPLDTFGVGYSYIGYSTPVKDLAPILLPVRDDQAVELYYNCAITPWFRLTPDFQILVPARERTLPPGAQSINTALLFGLRAKIDF